MSALQRYLFDNGVHGVDAVMVTRRVTGVAWGEASEAFFKSPLRVAVRDFQNWVMEVLALAADTDERQQQLCAERRLPWTPPAGGSVVEVEYLYDRCQEVLPYLGLPPGWRFVVAPGYFDVARDLGPLVS